MALSGHRITTNGIALMLTIDFRFTKSYLKDISQFRLRKWKIGLNNVVRLFHTSKVDKVRVSLSLNSAPIISSKSF